MRIKLECSKENNKKLESDIKNIKESGLKLPIQCEFIYCPKKIENINAVARAYYDDKKEEKNRIKFSDIYFKYKKDERMLTVLHEIIHLYFSSKHLCSWQEQKETKKTNIKKTFGQIRKTSKIPADRIEMEYRIKIAVIALILNNLDDMWAEKFMKDEYPELFKKRIKFLYKMRNKNIEEIEKKNSYHDFPRMQKFIWFWQLISVSSILNLIEKNDEKNLRF